MDLQALTVVLGLKIKGAGLEFKVFDFLLSREHRLDGVKELHFVTK
jgi:hypothetical protein